MGNCNSFYQLRDNAKGANGVFVNGSNLVKNEVRGDDDCKGKELVVCLVVRVYGVESFAIHEENIQIVLVVVDLFRPDP